MGVDLPAPPPQERSPAAWPEELTALVDGIVVLALFLLSGAVVVALGQGAAHAGSANGTNEANGASIDLYVGVLGLLTSFACTTVYWLLRRHAVPLRLRPAWALARYGIFMLAWVPLAFWLYPMAMRALEIPMPAQEMLIYLSRSPDEGFLWVALAVACIGAPLGEELLFRGFLFRWLELAVNRWLALALTTLAFAWLHEPSVRIPIFLLGGLFGYVRMKTGGVGSSILLHMVHNTWTVVLAMSAPEVLDLVFDQ